MRRAQHKGQASFILVFVLGLVSMMSVLASGSVSVSNVQIEEVVTQSDKALYAAWSGVDELMYRLRSHQDFGSSYSTSLVLDNGASFSATITGDNFQKIVRSSGFFETVSRNLEVIVASSSSKASFVFAVQAGEGGFEMEGNTAVMGSNNTPGNVFSNGSILGVKATSGQAGSKILGSAWALNNIGGLSSPENGGVYIQYNAWANTFTACVVGMNVRASIPPSNCPYGGTLMIAPPPTFVPIASVDVNFWKNKAQSGGIWNGDCNISATDGTDCSNGTNKIGNRRINGNLNLPSGTDMTVDGPLWVVGDISISQNNTVFTDEVVGKNSIVVIASDPNNMLAKGRITTSSNVEFKRNSQRAGLLFLSENTNMDCSTPAIDMTSNTATVVFIARDGCINVGSNSFINGILGKKIHIKNNSNIEYDPSLARAIVVPDTGGWAVVNISEY